MTITNKQCTEENIDKIISKAKFSWYTTYGKCTIMVAELECGFIMTESSACINKKDYDFSIGKDICLRKLKDRLWELEGYKISNQNYYKTDYPPTTYPYYIPITYPYYIPYPYTTSTTTTTNEKGDNK